MTIDITGLGTPVSVDSKQGSVQKRENGGENTLLQNSVATSSSTADTVTLTQTAVKLQDVEEQLNNIPIVDQQRVDKLKSAIESGRYEVNIERTADKLLELEAALHR